MQPYVVRAATRCNPACNRMPSSLQPHGIRPATLASPVSRWRSAPTSTCRCCCTPLVSSPTATAACAPPRAPPRARPRPRPRPHSPPSPRCLHRSPRRWATGCRGYGGCSPLTLTLTLTHTHTHTLTLALTLALTLTLTPPPSPTPTPTPNQVRRLLAFGVGLAWGVPDGDQAEAMHAGSAHHPTHSRHPTHPPHSHHPRICTAAQPRHPSRSSAQAAPCPPSLTAPAILTPSY